MLEGLHDATFPVQVRHGSPLPQRVFEVAHGVGIDAIEGGPVSYCLPYGRVPLKESIQAWNEAVRFWAEAGRSIHAIYHLESFAGCMMGQLAPPDLLVPLSVLEGRFFADRGIESLSLSYSQGTNFAQDVGAILALRRLSFECLPRSVARHIVLYTWMGVVPESERGARHLIEDSGVLAAVASVERVIVKTAVEAFQIPTVTDNIKALRWVADAANQTSGLQPSDCALEHSEAIYRNAKRIIEAVLSMAVDVGDALLRAFQTGVLDVPFCFHPDNRNEARAFLDTQSGVIQWDRTGGIPVESDRFVRPSAPLSAAGLLASLTYNKCKYDGVKIRHTTGYFASSFSG